ncbi:MAG TPA: heme biosynthesis HemY N-terminal domain-containing protein [Thermohalobaculum sp.]|nr:heme biosynthesis HemY N-terminal domain-containing protein [Thermohalobaculum sp.]
MLITAIRVLIFLVLVAAGIWGIFHLIEDQGGITIQLAGQEFFFPPIHFAVLLLIGLAVLWLTLKIIGFILAVLRFIDGDETAISRYFNRSRERRGLEAMAQGMAALAAGDARAARSKAEKAELLLQRPELTRLMNAQAAELAGDDLRAETYYRALAEDPETSYIGVRGLLNRALDKDDIDRALRLAESAAKLRPKEPSVLETLYMLQSRKFDWAGARKTLSAQRRAGLLPKPESNRRDSMLALAQAEDAEELGEADHARKLALEAAKLDPSNAEVVATAARHLVTAGSKRAAAKMIIEAWRRKPASALAAAFAAIEPDESAHERRLRFGKLLNAYPSHPESQLLAAELALVTKDWAGARKAIAEVKEDQPTARVCAIMAATARGEGAPEAEVRGWLARALAAPRGDGDDFDLNHAAMLPLLIGGDDETVEEAEELHDMATSKTPSDEVGNSHERPKSAA